MENKLNQIRALQQVADLCHPGNDTRHDCRKIQLMAICTALSDCDTASDIAEQAMVKEPGLRRCPALTHDVPSPDAFLRVARSIGPRQFG